MHQHSEGQNADAPELSLVDETWHDNWKQTFPNTIWFQSDHAEQLTRSTSREVEEDMKYVCMNAFMMEGKQRQGSSEGIRSD